MASTSDIKESKTDLVLMKIACLVKTPIPFAKELEDAKSKLDCLIEKDKAYTMSIKTVAETLEDLKKLLEKYSHCVEELLPPVENNMEAAQNFFYYRTADSFYTDGSKAYFDKGEYRAFLAAVGPFYANMPQEMKNEFKKYSTELSTLMSRMEIQLAKFYIFSSKSKMNREIRPIIGRLTYLIREMLSYDFISSGSRNQSLFIICKVSSTSASITEKLMNTKFSYSSILKVADKSHPYPTEQLSSIKGAILMNKSAKFSLETSKEENDLLLTQARESFDDLNQHFTSNTEANRIIKGIVTYLIELQNIGKITVLSKETIQGLLEDYSKELPTIVIETIYHNYCEVTHQNEIDKEFTL